MFALRYSFMFRYQTNRLFSVDIPLDRLAGVELNHDTVRDLVEEDPALLAALLGDYRPAYDKHNEMADYWDKHLQREHVAIQLVSVP